MPKILRSDPADEDLLEIWLYIAADDIEAADRLLSKIEAVLKLLAKSSRIGRRRDELAPGLRSIAEGNYVIFYRRIKDGIEVVRVLHGARDIENIVEQ